MTFDPKNFNSIIVEFELGNQNIKKLRKDYYLNSVTFWSIFRCSWGDSFVFKQNTIPSSVSLALEDQINERLIQLEKKTNELISTADSAIKTVNYF